MTDILSTARTGKIALAAATAKTVLQIRAPTNQRLKIVKWHVAFDGTAPTDQPVLVQLVRQSTDGTISTAVTLVKKGAGAETLQATAFQNATGEPTVTGVLWEGVVHPQSGYFEIAPPGQEYKALGGERIGIKVTAAAIVNVVALIDLEE